MVPFWESPPVMQDGDVIGFAGEILDTVSGRQEPHVAFQRYQDVTKDPALLRAKTRGGFVEEGDLRVADEAGPDSEAAEPAA